MNIKSCSLVARDVTPMICKFVTHTKILIIEESVRLLAPLLMEHRPEVIELDTAFLQNSVGYTTVLS